MKDATITISAFQGITVALKLFRESIIAMITRKNVEFYLWQDVE